MSVSLALLLSAGGAASDAKARAAGARATVRQADIDRCAAVAARDLDRFLSFLADDVTFFPDGVPAATGKAKVAEIWAPFFDEKGPALKREPVTAEVAASGDLAYTTGTYVMTRGSGARRYGKYVTVWKKRPRGAWQVAVDIDNTEPPPERDFGPPPLP